MAQRQFTTHEYDVVSFELREGMLGILNPGRYRGYDAIAADGAPGATIPLVLTHALTGIQVASNATTPVLSSPKGVAVTTQGQLIHEDSSISLAPTVNPVGSERIDVVYIEHTYVQVAGTNPATYGIITGTAGAGEPTLTSPNIRAIIGVIRHSANSTTIANLTWEPRVPQAGDNDLFQILFGDTALTKEDAGDTPVIGDRLYTDEYVVTDGESLAESIDFLDQEAAIIDQAVTDLGNRAIDSPLWGALTDITTQNATITTHGLLPKLSGNIDESFRGNGTFVAISKKTWVWRGGSVSNDFDIADFGTFAAANGLLDLSAIIPAGADMVYLKLWAYTKGTLAYSSTMAVNFQQAAEDGLSGIGGGSGISCPPESAEASQIQIMVGVNSSGEVWWFQSNAVDLSLFYVTVLGWQVDV